MFCSKCGYHLKGSEDFCTGCGSKTSLFSTNEFRQAQPIGEEETIVRKKIKKNFLNTQSIISFSILFIGLIALISALGIFLSTKDTPTITQQNEPTIKGSKNTEVTPSPTAKTKPSPKTTPQPTQTIEPNYSPSTPLPTPDIEATKQTIVDGSFPVDARRFVSYQLNINKQTQVKGNFTASGGSNDIDCLLIPATELAGFQKNSGYSYIYRSGYISQGNIHATLPPGSYYLIFSNTKAILTNKMVTAKITME